MQNKHIIQHNGAVATAQGYTYCMEKLKKIAVQIAGQSQPPVDKWKPDHVGEIDIRIDEYGNWFHEGEPILREKLVRLFASILWFEKGQHYLVTPAEKLAIDVADVPYIAHQMEYVDSTWVAVTNTHEQVIISQQCPVELREYQGQNVPYIRVRYDIWARVNRSIYYQWVTEAMAAQLDESSALVLKSDDYEFEVARL